MKRLALDIFVFYFIYLFFKDFIYLFLERKREGEREGSISVWLPLERPLLGTRPITQACALDWESNQRPFAGAQSTESHQPGLLFIFLNN